MSRMDDPAMGQQGQGAQQQPQAGQQLRDKASEIGQNVREMGETARDAAREQYDRLRESANQYYEQGRARAMEFEQGLEQYVQEKPLQALAMAAGVGLLLGLLWRRS